MGLKGKSVLVVGGGTSGVSTVNTLLELGAKVTINDKKTLKELEDMVKLLDTSKVKLILGEHPRDLSSFDLMVLSPGVPTDLPFIKEARENNMEIIGEIELGYQLCKGKFVAITGTNGKTTTTALTGEIFKNGNKETYVVGNIGVAAVSKALEASDDAVMITEVSSFQLESIVEFKPIISAILNITPDHLNRHKTMENYIDAKANVFRNQDADNVLVLNADDEKTYELAKRSRSKVIFFSRKSKLDQGAFVEGKNIVVKEEGKEQELICRVEELKMPGDHNLENALAAVAIAHWAGIDHKAIANTLRNFMGVEHRIEFVDEINGVGFVNDSKGTNPDASIRAVRSMKNPTILIAGGMDKGSEFDELICAFENKVKHMVLIGETAQKIKNTAQKYGFEKVTIVKTMDEAVNTSYEISEKGDTVLLSPACASWDMYPNFEIRGNHFKECAKKLRRTQ